MIRRRQFITLLGAAAAWPLAARAQQGNRVRRIGVFMLGDENDPVSKTPISAFTQALADLGWTDGRNVRMDLRWFGDDINRSRALAQELVGLQPDCRELESRYLARCSYGPRHRASLPSRARSTNRRPYPQAGVPHY